jgi:3-hydroxyisobutyrate dehydrogenase-like beta-hydroxyacid dehydrogenase
VLSSGNELGVALPNTGTAHQLYNALEAAGQGEEGTQALIKVLEMLAGESA